MRLWLLLAFTLALSCRTPTQITVKLRGVGLACKGGASPSVVDTGVAAKESYDEIDAAAVIGDRCEPASGANNEETDLGDVVLVPSGGSTNAEILAVTAVTPENGIGASAEECVARYLADECTDGACDACIFARRSLGFVEYSKLEVRIEFEPRCAGVICDSTETCSQGKCISAQTTCPTEECSPVEEGGSNPGGGGSGGIGGAGAGGSGAQGAGGSGGGAVEWEHVSPVSAYDLVGIGSNAQFKLYIAASDHVLRLDASGVTDPYPHAPASTFMTLAESGGEAISYGELGGRRSSNNFGMGAQGDNPTMGPGHRWDVAPRPDTATLVPFHYLEASSANGSGDTSADTGSQNPLAGAIFTTIRGNTTETFFAYNTEMGARLGRQGMSATVPIPASEWCMWGYADADAHFGIAVGGASDRVYVLKAAAVNGFNATTLTPDESLSVSAIWGMEKDAGAHADVFVAGPSPNGSSWWIGRTTFTPSGAPMFFSTLEPANAPEGTDIQSIWVGRADGAPKVFVAGNGGVFSALVSSFPTP